MRGGGGQTYILGKLGERSLTVIRDDDLQQMEGFFERARNGSSHAISYYVRNRLGNLIVTFIPCA